MTEPWTTGGLAALRAGNLPGQDYPGPSAHELARQLVTKSTHTAAITHQLVALLEIHPQSRLHFHPRNIGHLSARCHVLAAFQAGRPAQWEGGNEWATEPTTQAAASPPQPPTSDRNKPPHQTS